MSKSLLSIVGGSILALASSLNGQEETRKDTLVVYESPTIGTHQGYLLREVKKRYGDKAEYVELSKDFPIEIISKEKQEEIIRNNGKPKQVLVLADYKSFTKESVVGANLWIRDIDSDPFPDARIAFFPSHPKYVTRLTELIHRKPYDTESALTRFDDQVISFAKEGKDFSNRELTVAEKKDRKITVTPVKDQSKEYISEANSGEVDYIGRFGHSGPGFWQSTDLMNSFWVVGMDNETLLVNLGTGALKQKKQGEKFIGELNLEQLIKRDKSKKYPRLGSTNPKILDNWACCETILPSYKFNGHEFSTIIPNMVGNNAFVWGYERVVTVVPQAGAHQLLFWGSNGANSFTDSLLGSTIWVTAERERLQRKELKKTGEYQALVEDEFSGMFFGLPDNLTKAKVSSSMYDQRLEQTRNNNGSTTTKLELQLRSPTTLNDYRMRMWSPPVIILPEEINPLSLENVRLSIDGTEHNVNPINQKTYSTASIPEGEIAFIDNALVIGIAPVQKQDKTGEPTFIYKRIERDSRINLSFDSK